MTPREPVGDAGLPLAELFRIDTACDRFEAALRAGEGPEIATYLASASERARPRLLRELLVLELESRLGRGGRPAAGDYHARFPEFPGVIDEVFALHGPVDPTRLPGAAGPASRTHVRASWGQVTEIAKAPSGTDISPTLLDALRSAGYAVLGELGRGGMGIVYLAHKEALNRPCALKTILAGGRAGPSASERFRAEAEAVARLRHPGIVQVYHIGEADGLPFLEMEYLPGGSLADTLDGTPRPAPEAARLVETVARAIAEAHRLGVVHRDLKPANILIAADGSPKIADFGLAKSIDSTAGLTADGAVVGTPSYMAPEQAEARAGEVGPATDVYSLGVILYELLTGRPPFRAPTLLQTLDQVRSQEPVPPRQVQPSLPRDLETICLKCLHKAPRRRYADGLALADDVGRFLGGRPILARPTSAPERAWKWARRQPAVALLSAALVVLSALAFVLVSWQWRRAETRAAAEAVALRETRQARREAVRGQAQLALNHGLDLCGQGEIGRGLLWLARSLELNGDAGDSGLDHAIRINLAEWAGRSSRSSARLRHSAPVLDLAFRPDGQALVAAGEDGVARSWDTAHWQEAGPPPRAEARPPGQRAIGPINFDPRDGRMRLLVDAGGRGLVWDLDRDRRAGPPMELPASTTVGGAAFSPDGRRLVTCSSDGLTRWWEVAAGTPVGEPLRHGEPGGSSTLVLSPDGRTLVTGGEGRPVIRWEVATGKPLGPPLTLDALVRKMAYSRDGRRVLIGTEEGWLHLWEPERGRVSDLPPQGTAVTSLAVSPDGRLFATGTAGGVVRLWDSAVPRQTGQTYKFSAAVRCLAFRPDNRALAMGLDDATIRVWDLPRPPAIGVPLLAGGPVRSVSFLHRGTRLLADGGKGARWWDLAPPDAEGVIAGQGGGQGPAPGGRRPGAEDDPAEATAVSPDGRTLASARSIGGDGRPRYRLTLRDANTGEPLRQSEPGPDPPAGLTYSPDSRWLLTWGPRPRSALLWDVATLRQGRPLIGSLAVSIRQATFSPDGETLLLGCGDGRARLWDVARDREVDGRTHPSHAYPITAVAFDPHASRIVTGCHAGTVRLWDRTNGTLLHDVRGNAGEIVALAFSPDGTMFLTASHDTTARFWDVESGRQLGPALPHTDAVLCVAFSPDGRRVATGSKDGLVRLWQVPAAPRQGGAGAIRRWVEEQSGLKLDDRGATFTSTAEVERTSSP